MEQTDGGEQGTSRVSPAPPAPGSGAPRPALVRDLGELLRELVVASDSIAHRFAASHDLHPTDFRALTLIYAAEQHGEPLTPGRLAGLLNLSAPAVTYLVERLVASGHVERARDAQDRRRVILSYAPHGHEVAAAYFGPLGAHLGGALAGMGDEELTTLCAHLRLVRDALDGYVPQDDPS